MRKYGTFGVAEEGDDVEGSEIKIVVGVWIR